MADARLVLTVDTGVVHACSALNKPIVAFYCAGNNGTENWPLSTRRLVILAPPGCAVPQIDPELAIAETRRHGLPSDEPQRTKGLPKEDNSLALLADEVVKS